MPVDYDKQMENRKIAREMARSRSLSPMGEEMAARLYENVLNGGKKGKNVRIQFSYYGEEFDVKVNAEQLIDAIEQAERNPFTREGLHSVIFDKKFMNISSEIWNQHYDGAKRLSEGSAVFLLEDDPATIASRQSCISPYQINSITNVYGSGIYTRDSFFEASRQPFYGAVYAKASGVMLGVFDDRTSFDNFLENARDRLGDSNIVPIMLSRQSLVRETAKAVVKTSGYTYWSPYRYLEGSYGHEIDKYIEDHHLAMPEHVEEDDKKFRLIAAYQDAFRIPEKDCAVMRDEHTGKYQIAVPTYGDDKERPIFNQVDELAEKAEAWNKALEGKAEYKELINPTAEALSEALKQDGCYRIYSDMEPGVSWDMFSQKENGSLRSVYGINGENLKKPQLMGYLDTKADKLYLYGYQIDSFGRYTDMDTSKIVDLNDVVDYKIVPEVNAEIDRLMERDNRKVFRLAGGMDIKSGQEAAYLMNPEKTVSRIARETIAKHQRKAGQVKKPEKKKTKHRGR